jgi:hypothetical protein
VKTKGKAKRNPASEVSEQTARLARDFHGREVKWVENVVSHYVFRPEHAVCGELRELWLAGDREGVAVPLTFTAPRPSLVVTPDARTLYIVGGDQSMDWRAAGIDERAVKDEMALGEVVQIAYLTDKAFHSFAPTIYVHDFGDTSDGSGDLLAPWQRRQMRPDGTGPRPLLVFDGLNEALKLVGGAYSVRPEGIVF